MATAIYSLSADPITYGHIDIIERACNNFDKVIVAIGDNPNKKYLLNKEERLEVAKKSLSKLKKAEVFSFSGLLVDFAFEKKADVIIRGLRNPTDFLYEQDLNSINNSIDVGMNLDTYYLISKPSQYHVSSSTTKALVKEYTFVDEYLPLASKFELEKKINNQIIIGITGLMGAGKSFYSEILSNDKSSGLNVLNIDLDKVVSSIYEDIDNYKLLKKSLIENFGSYKKEDIKDIAFKSKENIKKLESLIFPVILFMVRQKIIGFKGIVIINAANIISTRFLDICNNNVIFIDSSKENRMKRCKVKRNIDPEYFLEIAAHQIKKKEQIKIFNKNKEKNGYGNLKIINVDNIKQSEVVNIFVEYIKDLINK